MEPKWNVKEYVKAMICYTLRINGTKVECKGKKIKVTFAAGEGINGTKVECKDESGCSNLYEMAVLMEPKWNVKVRAS